MRDGTYNAHIESTFLGWEDHGFFVMTLYLDYGDGGHQGYQRSVGSKNANWLNRLGSLLRTVGADSWEELPGKYVRVRVADGLIQQLGHITKDVWTSEEPAEAEPAAARGEAGDGG